MLEGHFFNPANEGIALALIQVFAAVLFCSIFLFLWRRSGVLYFGFWSLAWALETLALVSSFIAIWSGSTVFLWFRALLEFLFALSLMTAARSARPAQRGGERWSRVRMVLFSVLLLADYMLMWRLPLSEFRGLHAAVLTLIYAYTFINIGVVVQFHSGVGGKMLRFTLGCLFVQYLAHASMHFYAAFGEPATWMLKFRWLEVYDLIPQTLLAFSAMAMWIQTQQETITQLRVDYDALAKNAGAAERDHLTGLQNRMALDRHLDESFNGVVAVCDLDYFKDINDRFGHLVGDEVLRSVGNLIRTSIRGEDDAFRWGGDEFVIVFRRQRIDLAHGRMAVLAERLQTFRIRGHGLIPLGLSWGAAEGKNEQMRPVLEEADRQMYERKRQTHAKRA
jgi:diguanylate cyclase (GGDEF)-like protein